MHTKVSKGKVLWLFAALVAFILNPLLAQVARAVEVKLPSGEVLELSESQLEEIRSHPGVFYSADSPEALAGQAVVELPGELGGGFIYGTPSALAQAITEAGAAVGVTGEAVSAPISQKTLLWILAGTVVVGGAVAAAAAGGGGGGGNGGNTTPETP